MLQYASKQNKKQLKFAIFDEKQNNCIEPGDISWGFSSRSINKTTTPNKVLEWKWKTPVAMLFLCENDYVPKRLYLLE